MPTQLPISINAMDDEALAEFVNSPKEYLQGIGIDTSREDVAVTPSPFTADTRLRINDILLKKGDLTQADIVKQIDRYAMLKVTKIVINI
jgi:hypothetical protein